MAQEGDTRDPNRPHLRPVPAGMEEGSHEVDGALARQRDESADLPADEPSTSGVSNGATIDADGAVENGTKTCTPQCDSGQYELICQSRGPELQAPSPDDSLGCTGTKITSPGPGPNVGLYCCPCAN